MSGRLQIDASMVRRLLVSQASHLSHLDLQPTHPGWDNAVWRLGNDLAVRVPQSDLADKKIQREILLMPVALTNLSLPTPYPKVVGRPSNIFPWHWYVSPWVHGSPCDREPVSKTSESGRVWGRFLKMLHAQAPADAPRNDSRGVALAVLDASFRARLDRLGQVDAGDLLRKAWEQGCEARPYAGPPVWLHGDLHPANVIAENGRICGVVDFGEMCAGDPAADLASVWVLLPAPLRESCLDEYGGVDEDTRRRALAFAASIAVGLIEIGQAGRDNRPGGKPTWLACGERAVEAIEAADI